MDGWMIVHNEWIDGWVIKRQMGERKTRKKKRIMRLRVREGVD